MGQVAVECTEDVFVTVRHSACEFLLQEQEVLVEEAGRECLAVENHATRGIRLERQVQFQVVQRALERLFVAGFAFQVLLCLLGAHCLLRHAAVTHVHLFHDPCTVLCDITVVSRAFKH